MASHRSYAQSLQIGWGREAGNSRHANELRNVRSRLKTSILDFVGCRCRILRQSQITARIATKIATKSADEAAVRRFRRLTRTPLLLFLLGGFDDQITATAFAPDAQQDTPSLKLLAQIDRGLGISDPLAIDLLNYIAGANARFIGR